MGFFRGARPADAERVEGCLQQSPDSGPRLPQRVVRVSATKFSASAVAKSQLIRPYGQGFVVGQGMGLLPGS
jgi:hypothetical protein